MKKSTILLITLLMVSLIATPTLAKVVRGTGTYQAGLFLAWL